MLYVPGDQLEYCDKHKYPVLIVWKRTRYADVTWLNEPFQRSHSWLWSQEDFRLDIEARAEAIFQRYALDKKSARAIHYSMMTLYELPKADAIKAAVNLFDMTLSIIAEYENKREADQSQESRQ
ncbi:MAG: hypothetical protein RSE29_25925 [Leclercia sp.]